MKRCRCSARKSLCCFAAWNCLSELALVMRNCSKRGDSAIEFEPVILLATPRPPRASCWPLRPSTPAAAHGAPVAQESICQLWAVQPLHSSGGRHGFSGWLGHGSFGFGTADHHSFVLCATGDPNLNGVGFFRPNKSSKVPFLRVSSPFAPCSVPISSGSRLQVSSARNCAVALHRVFLAVFCIG